MEDQSWQDWFEEAWAFREDKIYPSLFGEIGPNIYPLDFELFNHQFHQASVDPRWLTHGVFESCPHIGRQSWLYVSSGLSNPWEADSPKADETSGLGCEFIMECPEQSKWALRLLQSMVAFQILLSVGRFQGKGLLQAWDRIPLRAPIDGSSSALTWVLLAPSPHYGEPQELSSGRFHFLQFIGVTVDEAEFARTNSGDKLLALLIQHNAAPGTNPNRQSVLSAPER